MQVCIIINSKGQGRICKLANLPQRTRRDREPLASKMGRILPGGRLALAVSFQEVVHSDRTVETGVTKLQHSSEGPNEHPQECPSHAAASRGGGAVGYGRRFFQS